MQTPNSESIKIKFTLYEFGAWNEYSSVEVIINGINVALGQFSDNSVQSNPEHYIDEISVNGDESVGIIVSRSSNVLSLDNEVHLVILDVPQSVYVNNYGEMDVRIKIKFTNTKGSGGFNNFQIDACDGTCIPKQIIVRETFQGSVYGWTKNIDNNKESATLYSVPGYGRILGKLSLNQYQDTNVPSTLSKTFYVPNAANTEVVRLRFSLFELDKWGGSEQSAIIINGLPISLGSFTYSDTQEPDFVKTVFVNDNRDFVKIKRESKIVPTQLESDEIDEVHTVRIRVPKVLYENANGMLDIRFEFLFPYWDSVQSVGIDNFTIIARRDC